MTVKLIIDTDPGIDDAMAILAAFNWPEVEVLGLTTLFGNVPTDMATDNALILRDLAQTSNGEAGPVPVCKGSQTSFAGAEKHRIADFVHGQDGFGNCRPAPSQASASPQSAVDFIIETVEARPGEVTVLALAACTNIALALRKRPKLHTQWRELVILGGAFQTSGNVNPAAEANIFGDPEAAEYVLSRCTNVRMVGLDTTHSCSLSAAELESMAGKGRHGSFLTAISDFYLKYHCSFYGMESVYLHDPCALVAAVRPDLFTWHAGAVVVAETGALRGKTLLDVSCKKWIGDNAWLHRPKVQVAMGAQADAVSALCLRLMCA